MQNIKKQRLSLKKMLFSLFLVFLAILALGELLSRIKMCLGLKDHYYLTAPFFKKPGTQGAGAEDIFVHFRDDEYRRRRIKDKKGIVNLSGLDWYYKLKPGVYPAPAPHNYGSYTINSLGFRGKEFVPVDKYGKIRIFCVGDSTVFGGESADEQTWPARLGFYLKRKNPGAYEVINAGFDNYCSLNYLNLIRYELVKYKPDLLIISAGINDLNIYRSSRTKKINNFVRKIHDTLYYRYSMFYTLLVERMSVAIKNSPVPMSIYDNISGSFFTGNTEKVIWFCRENNIGLIFVRQIAYTPASLFLEDGLPLAEYKKLFRNNRRDKNGVEYCDYLNAFRLNEIMKSLERLCRDNNVAMLDFRKEFYRLIQGGNELFFDYAHLSPRANDLLAMLVSQKLLSGPGARTGAPGVPGNGKR
jgi:lysophospholipase L1-like esterase